jgi:phosphoketolase
MQTPSANDHPAKESEVDLLDRYWRAANYLSVG